MEQDFNIGLLIGFEPPVDDEKTDTERERS
jgi:hypothetical protein